MPTNLDLEALIRRVEGAQLKIRELQQSLELDIGPGLQLKTWDGERWVVYGYHTTDDKGHGPLWYATYTIPGGQVAIYQTEVHETLLDAYIEALRYIMDET